MSGTLPLVRRTGVSCSESPSERSVCVVPVTIGGISVSRDNKL